MLDLKDSIKRGNKLSFKSNNLYQITSASNINCKRLNKNKYENVVYKNYNSRVNTNVSTVGCQIWDKVPVLKFKTRSKSMTLLLTK